MTTPYVFEVEVNQNEYLPAGGRVMDAVLSVRCASGASSPALSAAEVIVIDKSGSMSGKKLAEAKRATAVALDTLRDGVSFAIVAGTEAARMVYPAKEQLATLSAATRADAKRAVGRLSADDGTDIAPWLLLAHRLLSRSSAQVKHSILLTDGYSSTGPPFQAAVDRCRGVFICDSRGVGRDWRAEPLLRIAEVTQGSAAGLPEPGALSADFLAVIEGVMGTAATDVLLRVWTPADARITLLKQSYPWLAAVTGEPSSAGVRFTDYPIGQWGNETRHYHLRVEAPPGAVGDERAVARVNILAGAPGGTTETAERTVWINWTADPALSTRINPVVAETTGQSELAEAIEQGLDARRNGQQEVATAKLRRAVELAQQHGRKDTLRVLANVVDIDRATGTVRLKRSIEEVHAEMAKLESRKTLRTRPE